ncbi:MAG: hypothetical protein DRQ88_10650 [Epsilonproteobacteria bacterium]|nr:MAG: hypothetical protein DRQ89_07730 [Campylobacterota bacterium]RLA64643.1 MAG: hypothetical protein DRQ88_10650 [Campylobacterota bacterium]
MKEFCEKYLEILETEFKGLNLTRITDPKEFYNKQVLDSLLPLESSEIFMDALREKGLLVDVGFGGGFPLLPIAYKYPDIECLGIDSRRKKVDAVRRIGEMFHMEHLKVAHSRLEDIYFDRSAVLTFKAVGKITDLLPMIKSDQELFAFFYKGPNYSELERFDSVLRDWELVEEKMMSIPGTEGRVLLGFKKKGNVSPLMEKSLVKVSTLL